MKFLMILITIFAVNFSHASVWDSPNEWSDEWETKYRDWVKETVATDMFTNPQSRYYGIPTDCADFIYAMRILFSAENGLPFQVYKNELLRKEKPTVQPWSSYVSNDTEVLDHIKDPFERVKAFIEWLRPYISVYTLKEFDSLPVAMSEVKPGDFFIGKTTPTSAGVQYNHSYLFKEISPFGFFHIAYSTTPWGVQPLTLIKGLPEYLFKKSAIGWGIKRFIWPQFQKNSKLLTVKSIASNNELSDHGFGTDQYEHIKKPNFFDFVFQSIYADFSKDLEGPISEINRLISNACNMLEVRIQWVKKALAQRDKTPDKCLEKDVFGDYSTPARDSRIVDQIRKLYNVEYNKIYPEDIPEAMITEDVDQETYSEIYQRLVPWIRSHENEDYASDFRLDYRRPEHFLPVDPRLPETHPRFLETSLCSLKLESVVLDNGQIAPAISMTPSRFIQLYTDLGAPVEVGPGVYRKVRNLSSNPNDSFAARWGFSSKRTTCPHFDEDEMEVSIDED